MTYNGIDKIKAGDYVVFFFPDIDTRNDGYSHFGIVIEENEQLFTESTEKNLFGATFRISVEDAVFVLKASKELIDKKV